MTFHYLEETIAVATKSHADKVNDRFNNRKSDFISVKNRIDQYLKFDPTANTKLQNAIKTFKLKNPDWDWSTTHLVEARSSILAKILIDDTMNRPLVWRHVISILEDFDETLVMPINVYIDPEHPDKYVAWDGQHTVVVLYILSILIGLKNANKINVPIAVYPTNLKAKIREAFVKLNGDAKEPLSHLAIFSNKVFGFRIDNTKNTEWELANNKQLALADAGLFLTEKERGDTHEDGAITFVEKIDKNSTLESVQDFATYWKMLKQLDTNQRPVLVKELFLMQMFFDLCRESDIKIDHVYIRDVVDILWNAFECDFTTDNNTNVFFPKVQNAYHNWFKKRYHPGKEYEDLTEDDLYRIPDRLNMMAKTKSTVQDTYCIDFIIAQLDADGFTHDLPPLQAGFKPAKKDLW
jgi:hypothetical protein